MSRYYCALLKYLVERGKSAEIILFSAKNTTQFKFRNMHSSTNKVEIGKHFAAKKPAIQQMQILFFQNGIEKDVLVSSKAGHCAT